MPTTGESITAGVNLNGQRALITGGSAGIGREIARVLALRGAQASVVCRTAARGEAAVQGFKGQADVLPCDLTDMKSVRALAQRLIERKPWDLLMLNAGVFGQRFKRTEEGFEATYAANYLSHFLLLHELLLANALAPHARVVLTLTGAVHSNPFAKLDLDMLHEPDASQFRAVNASPNTKVMMALMGSEFTRRRMGTAAVGVACVGVSPGGVRTEGVENSMGPLARRLVLPVLGALMRSVEVGAAPLLWAATAKGLVSGTVFDAQCHPLRLNRASRNAAAGPRLWERSEKVLGLRPWPPLAIPVAARS